MQFCVSCVVALAIAARAHVDHEQQPIAGPHQSLWYKSMRAIPGDGGTQVRKPTVKYWDPIDMSTGRLSLQWHLHLWTSTLLSLLGR